MRTEFPISACSDGVDSRHQSISELEKCDQRLDIHSTTIFFFGILQSNVSRMISITNHNIKIATTKNSSCSQAVSFGMAELTWNNQASSLHSKFENWHL
jgi:hypothetical protein